MSAATLARSPARRGARWLALGQLAAARVALRRLEAGGDPEALHDFRVGLRRLRSTMRAYAPQLAGSVRGGDRRRLRALAKATGAGRDGEVLIAWVAARRDALEPAEEAGLHWLLAAVAERQTERVAALVETASADFPPLRKRLRRGLAAYTATVDEDDDDPAELPALGTVAAALLASHGAALREALAAVHRPEQQDEAHVARMEAKRLRYLAEPFAAAVPEAAAVLKPLRRLQDLLGDMHDAHVAAGLLGDEAAAVDALEVPPEPDPRPGLLALATLARTETKRGFRRVSRDWLGEKPAEVFARLDALAAALGAGAPEREIERKFLLRGMPRLPAGAVRTELVQGWLPGERLQERVRRVRQAGEEPRWYRTVKLGRGISRVEVEEACDEPTFRQLWRMTRGRRVRKLRFRVEEDGRTWEIDRFRGRRLFVAEVELPGEDAKVRIPAWLRSYVEREVTGDDAYVNRNLAG